MQIQSSKPRTGVQPPAAREPEKTITQKIVDTTVDKTLAGTDRVASSLAGLGTGVASYATALPGAVSHGARSIVNLYSSETIGPNIKVLATVASPVLAALAVAGAGLGLVVSAGAGAVIGFSAHDKEKPREFTIDKGVGNTWNSVRKEVREGTELWVKDSQEIKDKKLAPGEDPWDIPLPPFGRTAKTIAATVAGVAVGGVGGVATALMTTARGAWGGVKQAFDGFSAANLLAGAGTIVASPVTGLVHGLSKVVTTPVEAAAVAWKEKSLGGALKSAGKEAFDSDPSQFANSVGAFVGSAATAVPAGVGTAVVSGAKALGGGLKTAATDADLNVAGKALTAVATTVGAPVTGLVHGVASGIAAPFVGAAKGWQDDSLAQGVAAGIKSAHSSTETFSEAVGSSVGGVAVGGLSALATTGAAAVRQIGGGVVNAATNDELNLRGKLLEGLGGIPGDAITAAGQGMGALLVTPVKAGAAAAEKGSAAEGFKESAISGLRFVGSAVNPERAMTELVERPE
jgi:hypothetical protein